MTASPLRIFGQSWGILLVFLALGCRKENDYPAEPVIEMREVRQVDLPNSVDSVVFTIGYTDGDGDLGLGQGDTMAPFNSSSVYYNNIYIEYLEKDGNTFRQVKPPLSNIDTIRFAYRLPILSENKKPKPILGDITVGVRLDVPPVYSRTVKFKIHVFDRALHKSNVLETDEIRR